ncbi:MAG: sensor domain-containing diguanylate cyclase [bacterium]
MRTEKIGLRQFLEGLIRNEDIDASLRREIITALSEREIFSAWEKAIGVMKHLSQMGIVADIGSVIKNGSRFLRFEDLRTGDIFLIPEPPAQKIDLIPMLARGLVRREDSSKIERLFTTIATCRSEEELGGMLGNLLRTIREILYADYAAIRIVDEGLKSVLERISDGTDEPDQELSESLCRRWVIDEGFCLHIPSIQSDPKLAKYSKGFLSSVVILPVRCKERTYGLLEVWSRFERHFTSDDIGFLSLVAILAAGMISNAEYLESLIFKDPLTRVYNRGYLEDQLDRGIERYKRTNEPFAFLMIDVDNFKQVNSRFGHQAGDVVLGTLGRLLTEKVRQMDVVARYGGDEFGVILPDTIRDHAGVTAERLRSVVEEYDFSKDFPQLEKTRITISIGGAVCPEDALSKQELIAQADRALALAEKRGKNCVVFASSAERKS